MSDESPPWSPEEEALVKRWLVEAASIQPDRKAWAALIAHLKLTRMQEDRGRQAPGLSVRMTAAREAIVAVTTFLDAHKQMALSLPLFYLRTAIADVAEGRRALLFQPTVKSNSRKSTTVALVQAYAALTLDELILGKVEQTEAAAARKVASAVRTGRLAGFKKCTATTVIQWRYRLREGLDAAPDLALRIYRGRRLSPDAGDTPQSRAEWLLAELRNGLGFRDD